MRRHVLAAAALVALAVVLAALPIGSDVYEGGEAREGLVVREMLRTGDWILPLWNGSVVRSAGAAGRRGSSSPSASRSPCSPRGRSARAWSGSRRSSRR